MPAVFESGLHLTCGLSTVTSRPLRLEQLLLAHLLCASVGLPAVISCNFRRSGPKVHCLHVFGPSVHLSPNCQASEPQRTCIGSFNWLMNLMIIMLHLPGCSILCPRRSCCLDISVRPPAGTETAEEADNHSNGFSDRGKYCSSTIENKTCRRYCQFL